ncbi:low-density lipoprotein receptor-related protein 1-like [Oppia nitens]|uniref:low-density lipoprotein receptor-related protein 1-like n=1 Tax=Oppia nitens TaxID=1686743 RepID=UPI0023DAAF07|nr:low-density lipoprotein receptor-related protein 1-like [Oppia nitens]
MLNNDNTDDNEGQPPDITMVYSGTLVPQSLDYSLAGNYLVWTDMALRVIIMAPMDIRRPSLVPERTVLRHSRHPSSLSVDWLNNLLYWLDLDSRTVNVLNIIKPFDYYRLVTLDGSGGDQHHHQQQEPQELVVNVLTSRLLWTQLGYRPQIIQSLQDGTDQSVIYENDRQIFSLTIDVFIRRYYFLDIDFTLTSISFDGSDEKQIYRSQHLFNGVNSLSILDDDVYVSTSSRIYRLNKFAANNGDHNHHHNNNRFGRYRGQALVTTTASASSHNNNNNTYIFGNSSRCQRKQLYNVKVVDQRCQPKHLARNLCLRSHCSHICLPLSSMVGNDDHQLYRCLCPANMILVNNNSQCMDVPVAESVGVFGRERDLQKLVDLRLLLLLNASTLDYHMDIKDLFQVKPGLHGVVNADIQPVK